MALFKKQGFGPQHKKVVFLLAGWRMKLWSLWPASKILEKNGFYCITYTYDNSVFSPDVSKTVENFQLIKNDILQSISELKKKGYTEFSVAGGSLGSIFAVLVANESPDITKLILNTTGADTAKNVWISSITKGAFKESIIKQGYTMEKLQQAWRSIIPIHHIDNLKNKKILVYLSKRDTVIPFSLGMELIQAFEKRDYDYRLIINTRLGHIATAMYNSFKAKDYIDFLNETA